jgi:hypothetical protein
MNNIIKKAALSIDAEAEMYSFRKKIWQEHTSKIPTQHSTPTSPAMGEKTCHHGLMC